MRESGRWETGTSVVVRYVGHADGVLHARPHVVVRDDAELLALYLPAGTALGLSYDERLDRVSRSPEERAARARAAAGTHVWRDFDVLRLMPPGAQHSTWLFWRGGRHLGWYVNMEAAYRRHELGVDTTDNIVDLWVTPDLEWRWKDLDELDQRVERGLVDPDQARSFRREGERVIAAVEARASPFRDGWERWVPDAAWPIPALPAGWAELPGRGSDLNRGSSTESPSRGTRPRSEPPGGA